MTQSAVRRADVLYYGFSNAPDWYTARIATLAEAHGLPVPVGLQYTYSLMDRGVELDVMPAGRALGVGLVPWSPLGAGAADRQVWSRDAGTARPRRVAARPGRPGHR